MTFIDKLAPYRNKRIKGNTQKLLGSEVLQKMNARDNSLRNLKNPDLIQINSYIKKLNMMPKN